MYANEREIDRLLDLLKVFSNDDDPQEKRGSNGASDMFNMKSPNASTATQLERY